MKEIGVKEWSLTRFLNFFKVKNLHRYPRKKKGNAGRCHSSFCKYNVVIRYEIGFYLQNCNNLKIIIFRLIFVWFWDSEFKSYFNEFYTTTFNDYKTRLWGQKMITRSAVGRNTEERKGFPSLEPQFKCKKLPIRKMALCQPHK